MLNHRIDVPALPSAVFTEPPLSAESWLRSEPMTSTVPARRALIAGGPVGAWTNSTPPSLMFFAFQYVLLLVSASFCSGTYSFTWNGPAPTGLATGSPTPFWMAVG